MIQYGRWLPCPRAMTDGNSATVASRLRSLFGRAGRNLLAPRVRSFQRKHRLSTGRERIAASCHHLTVRPDTLQS